MYKGFPPLAERLTFEDQAAIEDVLDAAAAWQAGDMPWTQAASIGALLDWRGEQSQSYSRYVALRVTPRTDPRWDALLALVNVIVQAMGYVATTQGLFTRAEIRENEAGWQYANLERRAA